MEKNTIKATIVLTWFLMILGNCRSLGLSNRPGCVEGNCYDGYGILKIQDNGRIKGRFYDSWRLVAGRMEDYEGVDGTRFYKNGDIEEGSWRIIEGDIALADWKLKMP